MISISYLGIETARWKFGKILGSKRWRTTAIHHARDAESGYYSNVNSASEIVRRRTVTSGPANTIDLPDRISVSLGCPKASDEAFVSRWLVAAPCCCHVDD